MSTFDDRGGTKWDRAARYLRIAQVLHAHGDAGISAADIAKQIGVSKRTVYRDLENIDLDGGLPIWNVDGKFGLEEGAFLPPLALTLHEAMAFFLAARLLSKATDELDTEVIGAYNAVIEGTYELILGTGDVDIGLLPIVDFNAAMDKLRATNPGAARHFLFHKITFPEGSTIEDWAAATYFSLDGVHPNNKGYAFTANAFLEKIGPAGKPSRI